MAKKQFEWDYVAAGDLMLRSSKIATVCEKEAAKMTRTTGMEYVPDVRIGSVRVVANGYQTQGKSNGKQGICPQCGRWHPNCRCGSQVM